MSTHIMDSHVFGDMWSTPESRDILNESRVFEEWTLILRTLASSQSELGIIPKEAAENIEAMCSIAEKDLENLRNKYAETGHSILGFIQTIKEKCKPEHGEFLCYGMSVQDLTDTAYSRMLLKVHALVEFELNSILSGLITLSRDHKNTIMAGRTHGQIGLPITFGFKVTIWAQEVIRHLQRLKEIKTRLGVGQLSGGVGSLSAFGNKGIKLQNLFFKALELRPPEISWTNSRDCFSEFFNLLALISSTFGKIGKEVYNLQRPEIGELREGTSGSVVGSITMPHKRNPEISEHLATLAKVVRSEASMLLDSLEHEHERDGSRWKLEWCCIPAICNSTAALLKWAKVLLQNLEVVDNRMRSNLDALHGRTASEQVMLVLAQKIGKESSRRLIHKLAQQSSNTHESFRSVLQNNCDVMQHLTSQDLDEAFNYENQIGYCICFVERLERV